MTQAPYPVRPSCCSSPASRPSTGPSAWSPGRPTPPGRSRWPRLRTSRDPENTNPRVPEEMEGQFQDEGEERQAYALGRVDTVGLESLRDGRASEGVAVTGRIPPCACREKPAAPVQFLCTAACGAGTERPASSHSHAHSLPRACLTGFLRLCFGNVTRDLLSSRTGLACLNVFKPQVHHLPGYLLSRLPLQ